MAVQIIRFKKPYIWLSLVAGGNLTIGQIHYFIAYAYKGTGYYGLACSQASDESSITPTSGNQSIKVEWWQDGGDVTVVADAGGGDITVTAVAHGRANSDTVDIRGTTSYDGQYTISNVTTDTFDVTATYVADETGKWFADIGMHSLARMGIKWDYYSMIDSGTGLPYNWLNYNDPAYSGATEQSNTIGHLRWGQRFIDQGMFGSSNTYTGYDNSSTHYAYNLRDDADAGYVTQGRAMGFMPDICYNSYYYPLDSLFSKTVGTLVVYFDNTSTSTADMLFDALEASGYTGQYLLGNTNTNSYAWRSKYSLTVVGCFFNESGAVIDVKDLNIMLIGGQFFHTSYSPDAATNKVFTRCTMWNLGHNYYFWTTPRFNAVDTNLTHLGNALILDNMMQSGASYDSVGGSMTFYAKQPSGARFIGGYAYAAAYVQWRYQRAYSGATTKSIMTNMYFKDYYIYLSESGGTNDGEMTNIEFVNEGTKDYDVYIYLTYISEDVIEVMECTDVICNRPDGRIKIYGVSDDVYTVNDTWNMRFNINLTVTDNSGVAINGATVSLTWSGGSSSDTTDANGSAVVKALSYQMTGIFAVNEGGKYYTQEPYKTLTLTISKAGYQDYVWIGTISSGQTWDVSLIDNILTVLSDDLSISITDDALSNTITEDSLSVVESEDSLSISISDTSLTSVVSSDGLSISITEDEL